MIGKTSLWRNISQLGINEELQIEERNRISFFNQGMAVGALATFIQTLLYWPLIGKKALLLLPVLVIILTGLYINSKGKFLLAKRIAIPMILLIGPGITLLLSCSAFFYIGYLPTYTFILVAIDAKREKVWGYSAILFTIITLYVGIFNPLDLTPLSEFSWLYFTRVVNIITFAVSNAIFIILAIKIYQNSESKLFSEKEEISLKTEKIQSSHQNLEKLIAERTSELEEKNRVLEAKNNENSVLLQEINHRVKNNLQIIVSLINLQMSKIHDSKTKMPLQEIQSKIESISLVHKNLYEKPSYSEIHLNEYLKGMIENFGDIYGKQDFKYSLDIPDELRIDAEHAIPLGIILNEIITNFYKHCSSKLGEDASFSFALKELEPGQNTLIYKDNGEGFPEEIDRDGDTALGLELIESLVDQIDGEFHFYSQDGAVYAISFPIK
ncbi:MAG: sensor histidine kinase [Crocinitomicaceae bacterium]|nr:sensor histidine kinase [Crocinitomicaceae bacterium]